MDFAARREALKKEEEQVRAQATAALNQIAGRLAELDEIEQAMGTPKPKRERKPVANGHDITDASPAA